MYIEIHLIRFFIFKNLRAFVWKPKPLENSSRDYYWKRAVDFFKNLNIDAKIRKIKSKGCCMSNHWFLNFRFDILNGVCFIVCLSSFKKKHFCASFSETFHIGSWDDGNSSLFKRRPFSKGNDNEIAKIHRLIQFKKNLLFKTNFQVVLFKNDNLNLKN